MGPLAKCVDEIKFRIPIQVLREAFKDPRPNWRRAPISLDELILNAVIRSRVMVDCNLVGGQTVQIPLDGIVPDYVDNFSSVYHVPKERTQNRSIVAALSVGYMPYAASFNSAGSSFGTISPGGMNEVTQAAQRVSDAVSGVPPISNANVTLIAENTILLRDQFRVTSSYILRAVIGNEENMNNISPRSYLQLATLCEHAVKSFIYNALVIRVDEAFLQGGQELGALKSYIDSLADAETNYQTYLRETWQGVSFMNDTYAYDRFIKLMCNSAI